jgi:hypothetical protein
LTTLADAIAHAAQGRFSLGDAENETTLMSAAGPSPALPVDPAVAAVLADAQAARESTGWELVYSRQRALR